MSQQLISGKNGGFGSGWAATWKDDARPVFEQIEVSTYESIRPMLIRGPVIGWEYRGVFYTSKDAARLRGGA